MNTYVLTRWANPAAAHQFNRENLADESVVIASNRSVGEITKSFAISTTGPDVTAKTALADLDAVEHPEVTTGNYGDDVNHPAHYNADPSGVECIQVVRHRNFNIGNAIKYLWRAGLKVFGQSQEPIEKQIEDLKKARWYIADEIVRLGGTVD